MTLAYAISFLCFLRIDECLKLELRHFRVEKINTQIAVSLRLDFRKTHQEGGKSKSPSFYMIVYN
jgi:hypothetical protein